MLEYAIPMPYHPIQIRMWGQDIDHNLLQQLGTRDTSPAIRLQVQSCQDMPSLEGNAYFVDPNVWDYRVKPGFPAHELGLLNFDMHLFGVQAPD